ncbi:MAG: leucine-rich repeat domain-containing protein [Mobilitalea sp.]
MRRKNTILRLCLVAIVLLSFAAQLGVPFNLVVAKAATKYAAPKGSDKAVYQSGLDLSKKKGQYYTTDKETYIETTRFVLYLDKGIEVPVNIIELINYTMDSVEKETGYKFYVKHLLDQPYYGMNQEIDLYFKTSEKLKKVNSDHEKIEIVVPNDNKKSSFYSFGGFGILMPASYLKLQEGKSNYFILNLIYIALQRNGRYMGATLSGGFAEYYTEQILQKYTLIKSTYDAKSELANYEGNISEENMEHLFINTNSDKLGYRMICYIIEKYGVHKFRKLQDKVTEIFQEPLTVPMDIVAKAIKSELSKDFFTEFANWYGKNLSRFGDIDISTYGDWHIENEELIKYYGTDKDVVLPETISTIGYGALEANFAIVTARIPNTVINIAAGIFENCINLRKVRFSDNISIIGDSALSGCSSLKEVILPKKLMSLQQGVFYNCTSLKEVKLPEGLDSIGVSVFNGCTSLKNITLPSTLTSIGHSAFSNCSSLESIVIPKGVTELSNSMFLGCKSLKKVILNKNIKVIPNFAFRECSSLKTIILPSELTKIGEQAFNLSGLTYVTIPSKVTVIEDYAFGSNKSLKKIYIPKSVKSIGANAFIYCDELTIYGEKDSYVEKYAQKYGFKFVVKK